MIRRVGCLAAAVALLLPATAHAHAVLERTVPKRGAELERPPDSVEFHFNEPVEASFGAIRVYDSEADQVEAGEIFRPDGDGDGDAVAVRLDRGLADGTYTATYRVVSADAHPVSGGFVFTIGDPRAGASRTVSELLDEGDAGGVTSFAFWGDRWIGYGAIGLVVGALVFWIVAWRGGFGRVAGDEPEWSDASSAFAGRVRYLVGVGIACGIAASLIALPLQGATAGGTSFWAALDPETIADVLDTRFGTMMALRSAAWAVLALALIVGGRYAAPLAALPLAFVVISPALTGHASTQSPTGVLVPADTLHVAAMSVWFGGLAALVFALPSATRRLQRSDRTKLLAATLVRFSPLALAAVLALAASGVVQAIVEVGSFEALIETGFGRTVVAKGALLGVLIGFGAANRQRLVPAIERLAARREPLGEAGRGIRRNVRSEVALIAVVLGLAAVLVGYAPPSETQGGPVSGRASLGDASLEYTVDPATIGRNQVHLYLFDAATGRQFDDVRELGVDLSLPDADIGPIEADVRRAGPGHYVAPSAPFGVAGDWEMEVAMRVGRFDQATAELNVPIE